MPVYRGLTCLAAPSTCESDRSIRYDRPAHWQPSQNFNEIMPAIYARFMEKEARQWRQIYKVCPNRPLRVQEAFYKLPEGLATTGISSEER